MENMELFCFNIISQAGSAKSSYLNGLRAYKMKQFDSSKAMLKEGDAFLREAHKTHMGIISHEASGNKTEFSLLLIHAEDQINTAEIIKILVDELIELHPKS
jgi:PTS system cellobiose-specific IIA component